MISDGWCTGESADEVCAMWDEQNDRNWDYEYEEESPDEARTRMTDEERARDEAYSVYLDDANQEAAE